MKTFYLSLVCLLLISFDCFVTEKRIRTLGPKVELNPVVRFLSEKLGAFQGSFLGVGVPGALLVGLFGAFGLNLPLAYLAGVRSYLALQQLISLKK